MSSAPRVLVLGSCRVSRPLRRLHEQGLIDYVNFDERIWFTHTSAGARQTLNVLRGDATIPQLLRPTALETHLTFGEDMSAPGLTSVDVVVVEVSSLKRHTVDGVELNAHKIYGAAVAAGVEARQLLHGNTEGLPDEHLLKPMRVTVTRYEELAADLLSIREAVGGAILTVDHLYSELPDGSPIPEREKLSGYLRQAEAEYGIPHYSTKPAIVAHGIDKALSDSTHYRPEFEPVVSELLLPLVTGPLAS